MSTQRILGGVLLAQVGLAVATWWPRGADVVEATPLVPGGGNAITAIEIVGPGADGRSVKLVAKDGAWLLASDHDYPVEAQKVGEVLDALGGIRLGSPIATQAASFEALGVTDAKYERKVTVTTADGPISFLVGGAKAKAIHLRPVGVDAVYEVGGVSAWTFKDAAKGYLPANHVDLDPSSLVAVTITNAKGTIELARGEAGWTLGGATPGPADAAAVDKLLGAVTKVRLAEVVGTTVTPEQGLEAPAVRVTWTAKEGETTTSGGFVVGAEQGSNRYLKSDASPFVVLSPVYKLGDLVEADAASLVGAPATEAPPPDAALPPEGP